MKRLSTLAGLLALCALLIPQTASAQAPFAVHAAAIEGGFYNPNLDFYANDPNYLLDFSSGPMVQGHLEAMLFGAVGLRGSIGYWSQDASDAIGVGDPDNARTHEATLRIVPITGTLYYSLPIHGPQGFRPLIGAGITQNLVQRTFERELLSGDEPRESFEGNGRNYSYHILGGMHQQLIGPVWFGLEGRYVFGRFEEDPAGDVDIDGLQLGLSLRYHLGR